MRGSASLRDDDARPVAAAILAAVEGGILPPGIGEGQGLTRTFHSQNSPHPSFGHPLPILLQRNRFKGWGEGWGEGTFLLHPADCTRFMLSVKYAG